MHVCQHDGRVLMNWEDTADARSIEPMTPFEDDEKRMVA